MKQSYYKAIHAAGSASKGSAKKTIAGKGAGKIISAKRTQMGSPVTRAMLGVLPFKKGK